MDHAIIYLLVTGLICMIILVFAGGIAGILRRIR